MAHAQKNSVLLTLVAANSIFLSGAAHAGCGPIASGASALIFTAGLFSGVLFLVTALFMAYKSYKSRPHNSHMRPIITVRFVIGIAYILGAALTFFIVSILEKIYPIEVYSKNYPYNHFYLAADYYGVIGALVSALWLISALFVFHIFFRKKVINLVNATGLLAILFAFATNTYYALDTIPYFVQKEHEWECCRLKEALKSDLHDLSSPSGGCPPRTTKSCGPCDKGN